MKKTYISFIIIVFIAFCTEVLNAKQPGDLWKDHIAKMINQNVFFNDNTPAATISEVADDYFIAKVENDYSIIIPFNSVCKIEIIGKGKDKIVTIYLIYHKDKK